VVSALEAELVLVGGEDVSRVGVLLVGDEWPAAIGARIGPDDVLTDLEVDPVLGASGLAVAGVCAGAPPGLLAATHLFVVLDGETHPPCSSNRADRLVSRLFHRDPGLQSAPDRLQFLVQLVECGDAGRYLVAAGLGVSIDLV